ADKQHMLLADCDRLVLQKGRKRHHRQPFPCNADLDRRLELIDAITDFGVRNDFLAGGEFQKMDHRILPWVSTEPLFSSRCGSICKTPLTCKPVFPSGGNI